MEFGPANFPAVIDSPIMCYWSVVGPHGSTAIEFLFADVPINSTCNINTRTGNCLAVVQPGQSDTVLSTPRIQRFPVLRTSALVVLVVHKPLGFRGFHARFIEDQ